MTNARKQKLSITESTSFIAHSKEELIKAYYEIIFLYTKVYRTHAKSAFTRLGFLQKGPSAILGTGCGTTDAVPTTCPTFLSNDKGKQG